MIDNDTRRFIDELGREQDRMMLEHERWTAAREAEREALMQKSEPEGLLYREHENNEQAAATESSGLGLFGDDRDHLLARALGFAISQLRQERRAAIAALQKQWQDDLDSRDGKIMHALARAAYAGERAEQEAYETVGRITRLELLVRKHLAGEPIADIVELTNSRRKSDAA